MPNIALMDRFGEKFTEGDNFKHYATGFLERRCTVFQLDPYTINFAEKKGVSYPLLKAGNDLKRSALLEEKDLESYDVIMDLSDVVDPIFAANMDKINTLHINSPIATYRSADKRTYVETYPEFIPETIISSDANKLEKTLNDFGGRMIVKDPFGSCGKGVEKVDIKDPNYREILKSFTNEGKTKIVAQEFMPLAFQGSKRVAVLGNIKDPKSYEIIHFYKRKPLEGNWKDNLSQGGKVVELGSLREDEIEFCLNVAKKSGLYVMGLDIMDDLDKNGNKTLRLIETNAVLALAFGRYPDKLKKVTDFILEKLM